ncbi:MAG: hypothetical protein K9L17_09305 [Clostridiales bacterium]|nr:hypothetical protein [Clostridiales bacterium]
MIDNFLESEDAKLTRVKKHGGALELQGFYQEKRVILYGQELTKDKICETYGWAPEDVYFSWGESDDLGGFYLACAILLEVYNKDRAYNLAKNFQNDFIISLPRDDFNELFNIQVWFTNWALPKSKKKPIDKEGLVHEGVDDD